MKQSFIHTRAALIAYDAGGARRQALYEHALSDDADPRAPFEEYDAQCEADEEAVTLAFYEDTKEYNSLERAQLVHINTLREWCSKMEVIKTMPDEKTQKPTPLPLEKRPRSKPQEIDAAWAEHNRWLLEGDDRR